MKSRFVPHLGTAYPLPPTGSWPPSVHRWDHRMIRAVQMAWATERPLLVRGEPGLGKSQIARAAAAHLNLPLLSFVVHARSEAHDLLYHHDAVSRLAQAQALAGTKEVLNWEERLAEDRFLKPGVLWWAFNWVGAKRQADRFCRPQAPPEQPNDWKPEQGCVVLIDEIDKADSDLPNGLLESLGNLGFEVPPLGVSVRRPTNQPAPLVVVTTNEERELPAAFLRRCLVLKLELPKQETEFVKFLVARGRDHFESRVTDAAYVKAAQQLFRDREAVREPGSVLPGAAEYLDLLSAIAELYGDEPEQQESALDGIHEFVLRKNPDEVR